MAKIKSFFFARVVIHLVLLPFLQSLMLYIVKISGKQRRNTQKKMGKNFYFLSSFMLTSFFFFFLARLDLLPWPTSCLNYTKTNIKKVFLCGVCRTYYLTPPWQDLWLDLEIPDILAKLDDPQDPSITVTLSDQLQKKKKKSYRQESAVVRNLEDSNNPSLSSLLPLLPFS